MKWYDMLKATGPFGWLGWLVSAFNKNDNTFNKIGEGVNSAFNRYTGAGLTNADREANAWSAEEAQKQRDWEEEMRNTSFQAQVKDMQKAGLNTALMYGGTGSSGATVPSGASASSVSPSSGNIGDLLGSIMDIALLGAQIENIKADTANKNAEATGRNITNANLDAQMKAAIDSTLASAESAKAEALYKNLLIQYGMPEAEVQNVLKQVAVGDSTISKNEAEAELARVNAAYAEVKKKIDLDKLPYELESMSASAREGRARAIVEEFRGAYMQQNNTDVPSGAVAALVGLISNTFHGLDNESESGWNELNTRTLFPFIDMLLSAFGK